ncbi:MAG: hypothetical protein FWD80_04515 [Propionibacteriaceae bacterium]|nr:hypothetical protein [Propionibacteriaceae bacterium]
MTRSQLTAALPVALVAAALATGCSAVALDNSAAKLPGEGAPISAPSPVSPDNTPGVSSTVSMVLVSTNAIDPDGIHTDVTGTMQLSLLTSANPDDARLQLRSVIGGCTIVTTPAVRDGDIWTPDVTSRITAANGCASYTTTPQWIIDLLDHPFRLDQLANGTVQLHPAAADIPTIDFAWQQQPT